MTLKKAKKVYFEGQKDCLITKAVGYKLGDFSTEFYLRFYSSHACPACGYLVDAHHCSSPDYIEVEGTRFYKSTTLGSPYIVENDVEVYVGKIQRSIEEAVNEALERASALPDIFLIER